MRGNFAEELWRDARQAAHSDSNLVSKLRDLLDRIEAIKKKLKEQDTKVDDAMAQHEQLVKYSREQNVTTAQNEHMLNRVNHYLENDAREALEEAKRKSQRASDQSTKVQTIAGDVRSLLDK